MSEHYDVILFGVRGEGEEMEQAKQKIAALLHLDQEKIDQALNSHTGLVIHSDVTMDVARKLQNGLLKVGGLCNFRPTNKSTRRLELVPLEVTEDKPHFQCPACGFQEDFENDEEIPGACPNCGVVPDKYSRVQQTKEERERIKRRLLEAHRAREQQGMDEYERRQQEARRMQLEEEIRKELGLPRSITTRGQLVSSAAALWVTGVLMGVGTVLTYQMLTAPLEPPSTVAAIANPQVSQPKEPPAQSALGGIPPNQELSMQMASFTEALPVPPAEPAPATPAPVATTPATLVTPDTGEVTITRAAFPAAKPILSPTAMWESRKRDLLWDRFLAIAVTRQLEAHQLDKALGLADAIAPGRGKWISLLSIANVLHHQGDIPKRNQLLDQIETQILALANPAQRAEGLGLLAHRLKGFGELQRAGDAERKAEKLVSEMPAGDEKISALGALAAARMLWGADAKADTAWHDANRIVAGLKDPAKRLRQSIQLADTYDVAGRRTAAIGILASASNLVDRIPDADQRADFLLDIATGFGRANDVESALTAAARQTTGEARDQTRLDIVLTEISNADPYLALRASETLELPVYRAQGLAAVAWSLKAERQLDKFAQETFSQAVKISDRVTHPSDQAISAAVLNRYAAWMGQPPSQGTDGVNRARSQAKLVDDAALKDTLMAVLAAEEGKAQLIDESRESASEVMNSDLSKQVTDDLAQFLRVAENLQ